MTLNGMVRLSTITEATGLAHRTLKRRCELGQIRGAVKEGGRWYIPEAAVESISRERRPKGSREVES